MADSSASPGTSKQEMSATTAAGPPARRYLLPALVAFVFRLEWMVIAGSYALYRGSPFDAWLYGFEMGAVSRSLTHGFGYTSPFDILVGRTGPTAWVSPLYPLIIAVVTKLFGSFSVGSVVALMTMNCLFSALTCIPIYLVAEETLGRRVAWVATWAWALLPYFNRWHVWIWDVNLSALLLASMFWITLRAVRSRSWRWELALGVVTGVAALSNPALLSFLPVALGWLAWRRWIDSGFSFKPPLRAKIVVVITIVAMITPWIVRNRLAFGQWVFLRSNFGAEFYLTNQHALLPAEWLARHPSINWYESTSYREMGEISYNRDRMRQAKEYVKQYPGEFTKTTLYRAFAFWSGSVPTVFSDDATARFRAYVPLSVLGLAGLALLLARRQLAAVLYIGVVALYPLVFYITYPLTRQRHAIEPILLILAASLIVELFSWISSRAGSLKPFYQESRVRDRVGWGIIVVLLIAGGTMAIYRTNSRRVEAFSPQSVLLPEHFILACGRPDATSSYANVTELDYQKAQVRVRIIDNTYGWIFDRHTGNLMMPAQSLGCWKKATTPHN